jgi:predicted flap endonuclease-1-like 5' DNA nuclease
MTYLLAKYTVLFLLTAFLGFVLGYWYSRRKFVDVTESYEDLRKASSRSDTAQWEKLWKRLDSMPAPKETDLSDVNERIAGVTSAIATIPHPEPVSFAPIENRLDSLQESIQSIPAPLEPKDPDFLPLIERLNGLDETVKAIPVPEKPAPVDFTTVTRKLDNVEEAVRNIPDPAPAREVDLRPVTSQLNGLQQSIATIPQPKNVDLAPIDERLTAIEAELGNLGKRLASRTTNEGAPRKTNRDGPQILSAALYGNKDDLKLISGVGPKLEKLLNQNGVFYFWQVADWNARDIDVIDERLDVFKGRIARDNWVSQAKQLRRTPGAASMPAAG